MKATRRSVLAATAGLAVPGAGCIGRITGADEAERDTDAEELLDRTRNALETVSSYRFEVSIRVEAADGGRGDRYHGTIEGAIDVEANRMYQSATLDGRTREGYVIDDTVYQECARMGWGAEELEEDVPLIEKSPAAMHLSLFDSGDLRLEDGGSVHGRETSLLIGHPPPGALDDSRGSGLGSFLPIGGPSVDDIVARSWIDRETDRPMRTELEFEVSQRGERATASLVGRFTDYDEPVDIELPEEAIEDQWELGCPEN